MRPLVLTAAIALVAAGCLGSDPTPGPTGPTPVAEDLTDLIAVDHDHTDATLHTDATPNLVEVGFTDLTFNGAPSDANSALDVHGDWLVIGQVGATSGFSIVDVSDKMNPTVVSHFSAPNTYGADVKFDSTGNLVFLATQWAGDPANPASATLYDLARVPEGPMVWGVYVVDVTDKTKPELQSFLPLYRGVHSVHYHEIGGEKWVFMCTYHFIATATGPQANPVAVKVVVGRLEPGPDGKQRITPVSEYSRNVDPNVIRGEDGRVFPHELSVSKAPVDGKTYAWLSYWDHGLVVLDATDPANLREAGHWAGFEKGDGALHYAATFPYLIHGRQVTITQPEWTTHDYSGKWWALDTTDLSDIKTIGWWTLPGEPAFDANYRFSPHNFDLYGTWVIGANYHAGVWVWDIDPLVRHYVPDEEEDPAPSPVALPLLDDARLHGESVQEGHGDLVDVVGYFMEGRTPRSTYYGGESPLVWLSLLRDGHLYMSDMDTGLRIVRFTDVPENAQGFVMKTSA